MISDNTALISRDHILDIDEGITPSRLLKHLKGLLDEIS
jgi:hypothetical protein